MLRVNVFWVLFSCALIGAAYGMFSPVFPQSPYIGEPLETLTDVGWVECFAFSHASIGPSITEIKSLCASDSIFLACAPPGPSQLIIAAGGAVDDVFPVSGSTFIPGYTAPEVIVNGTVVQNETVINGTFFYLNEASPGVLGFSDTDNSEPANCPSEGNANALCWTLLGEDTVGGGTCAVAGFTTSVGLFKKGYTYPCEGLVDGDPCTLPEGACSVGNTCAANGTCSGGTQVTCPAPTQCQESVTCNRTTGGCDIVFKDNTQSCDDGNPCTTLDTCDGAGGCNGGPPAVCPTPATSCLQLGFCNSTAGSTLATACQYPPQPLNTACSDGDACTIGDKCDGAGACTPGPQKQCDSPSTCQDPGSCNSLLGLCIYPPKLDTTPCNITSNACILEAECQAGQCEKTLEVNCTSTNPCIGDGVCSPFFGTCSTPFLGPTTPCNQSDDLCTTGGTFCDGAGQCLGQTVTVCTALDDCHLPGTCNPFTGDCDDPLAPATTVCSDNDECTEGDQCDAFGGCVPGPAVTCPGDDCNLPLATCNPVTKCKNPTNEGGTCDDGDICTLSTVCVDGDCVGGFDNPSCQSGASTIRSFMRYAIAA